MGTAEQNVSLDTTLHSRLLLGEARAQREFYEAHVEAIYGALARWSGNRDEVEDIVQETFVSAFRDLSQLKDQTRYRPWLLRIAYRIAQKKRRRRRLWFMSATAEHVALASMASPSASPETVARLKEVDEFIKSLSEDERTIFRLRMVEGFELDEVAYITELSLSTVKRRLADLERRQKQTFGGEL